MTAIVYALPIIERAPRKKKSPKRGPLCRLGQHQGSLSDAQVLAIRRHCQIHGTTQTVVRAYSAATGLSHRIVNSVAQGWTYVGVVEPGGPRFVDRVVTKRHNSKWRPQ